MYGAGSQCDGVALQRAVGELRVEACIRDGRTVLEGLRQAGCLKARFPRPDDDDWMSLVTLNTSGGIAGGDVLDSRFGVGPGAHVSIASQAAERFYRASPGSTASDVRTHIAVAAGGAAEWLPQETILFDRCAVRRHLHVELAADAWFLGIESLLFGRTAMGETVECASLRDLIEVWRDGRVVLHDAIRLEGEFAAPLQRQAIAAGALGVTTLVHVASDAEAMLKPLRSAGIAASAWDGMLVGRILAATGAELRVAVVRALQVLRGGRSLPRVWLC